MNLSPSRETTLSPAERTRQIAELLVKAILHAEAKRAVPDSADLLSESAHEPVEAIYPDDERIVRYLEVAGTAPPSAIREALGLPKTSAYRSFVRLAAHGRITTAGRSRGIAYSLVVREPPPERIALN